MNSRTTFLLASCILLLALVFVAQLMFGSVSLSATQIFSALFSDRSDEVARVILHDLRLPSAIAATLAGAALAVSGLHMQTMFRNPVAGPYVLGISAGASLGVALLLLSASAFGTEVFAEVSASGWGIVLAAGVGAALIFLLNFFIASRVNDVVAMLIIGLMIGGGISALIEVLQSFANREALRNYVIWTFGSFKNVSLSQCAVMCVFVLLGLLLSFALTKRLNVLLLGDSYAQTSGLNVRSTKALLIVCTSLLAGSVTAFCGPIGFVGLAVPHIARGLFRTADHRLLTLACILVGGIVCGVCSLIASVPGADFVLPLNAVTSLFGAPFVIWIILKRRNP